MKFNELTIGHFHTLVCTAFILIGIIISKYIVKDQTITFFQEIDVGSFVSTFCAYILVLLILTLIVEFLLCLKTFQPVYQDRKSKFLLAKVTRLI